MGMRGRMCVKTALIQAFNLTDRALIEAITTALDGEGAAAVPGGRRRSSGTRGQEEGLR